MKLMYIPENINVLMIIINWKRNSQEIFDDKALRKESNQVFYKFQELIQKLKDFKIPREFFGLEPLKNLSFNLPDSISLSGFRGHLASVKIKPTIKVNFDTVKNDLNKNKETLSSLNLDPKNQEHQKLLKFYESATKDRINKEVKALGKRTGVKRKRKEQDKKILQQNEYQEMYKNHYSALIDI